MIAVIAILTAGCQRTTQQASPAASAGASAPPSAQQVERVVLAATALTGRLNAWGWTRATGLELAKLQYDTLTQIGPSGQPEPWLATSWTSDATATQWDFVLRTGVRWHDGKDLTAEDVAFSFNDPFIRSIKLATYDWAWQVEVVDATTVRFITEQPEPDLPIKLDQLPIIPKHVWETVGRDATDIESARAAWNAVEDSTGSGPYRLIEYEPDVRYRFEANDDFFLGPPAVRELEVVIIPDPSASVLALKAGEVDALIDETLSRGAREELAATDGFKVVSTESFATWMLYINNTRPPFDNANVRRALALTIDGQELVDAVLGGAGTPGNQGFVHPLNPESEAITLKRDLDKAKSLLEAEGYTDRDGDGIREDAAGSPLRVEILAFDADPIRAADVIGEWAKEAGFDLFTTTLDSTSHYERLAPGFNIPENGIGDYTLAISRWSAGLQAIPASTMRVLFYSDLQIGRRNYSGYVSAEADKLLDEIASAPSKDARAGAMKSVQAVLAADSPAIVLWYPDQHYAYRPAAYDGWRVYPGAGLLNKITFLPSVLP